jgi:hypothetical protein
MTLGGRKLRLDPRNSFIVALAVSDFFLCNFTSPLTLWHPRHKALFVSTDYPQTKLDRLPLTGSRRMYE